MFRHDFDAVGLESGLSVQGGFDLGGQETVVGTGDNAGFSCYLGFVNDLAHVIQSPYVLDNLEKYPAMK